ncbi:MAG: bifunctional nuclease family protein [Candidatus Marinimicrobia bacterium]|nr:bifunctional nuclease family protein [Candidatus Neomarinimicrobiota bacterium]
MIEVIVKNILFFAQAAAPGYTLFLQARGDEERSLPIVVGQFEAQAIALALEQIRLERPMTHDLLSTVITHMTGGLDSVIIKSLRDGTFFAELNVRNGDEIQSIDARPSDAIALALRARVPIRVSQKVFEEASIPIPATSKLVSESEPSLAESVNAITRRAEQQFDLEKDLRSAVIQENYELAALIRDKLHALADRES